jgi:hypothetical protein
MAVGRAAAPIFKKAAPLVPAFLLVAKDGETDIRRIVIANEVKQSVFENKDFEKIFFEKTDRFAALAMTTFRFII